MKRNKDEQQQFNYKLAKPEVSIPESATPKSDENAFKKRLIYKRNLMYEFKTAADNCSKNLSDECKNLQLKDYLTERMLGTFLQFGAETIRDLIALDVNKVMDVRGFGERELQETTMFLNNVIKYGADAPRVTYQPPYSNANKFAKGERRPVTGEDKCELAEDIFNKIKTSNEQFDQTYAAINSYIYQIAIEFRGERDALIFAQRYFLPETPSLGRIGSQYDLTRERIRQICDKSKAELTYQLTQGAPAVRKYAMLKELGADNYFAFMIYCKQNCSRIYYEFLKEAVFDFIHEETPDKK